MKKVTYNGYECEIIRTWDGGYYDIRTISPTEKGILEEFLSVHRTELLKQGNKNV